MYGSFWLGSQATGQPIYQYRIILPFDESTVLNCATDADFNIEGDYKMSLSKNITWKVAFAVRLLSLADPFLLVLTRAIHLLLTTRMVTISNR